MAAIQPVRAASVLVDPDFQPVIEGRIFAMVEQADGRILLAGQMSRVNTVPVGPLARIKADGTLDEGFHRGQRELEFDHRCPGGGSIYLYQWRFHRGGWRANPFAGGPVLLANGTVDGTFVAATNELARFSTVRLGDGRAWRVDTKMMLGVDGLPDRNFLPDYGPFTTQTGWDLLATALAPDDSLVQSVGFYFGPSGATQVFRLMPDGSPDESFPPGGGALTITGDHALAFQKDGHLLIADTGRELVFRFALLDNCESGSRIVVWPGS